MTDKSELFPDVELPETPLVETPSAPVETPAPTEAAQTATPAPAETQPVVSPTPAATPAPGYVPIDVLLRTRDEAKEAKRRADAAERQIAEIARKQREAAAQMPNPLDDPDVFNAWLGQQFRAVREEVTRDFQGRSFQERAALSREMMEDQLGDKFGELAKFIDESPDELHAQARQQAHPYRWFYRQFQQAEKAKRAEALAAQVGDKSIDDIVAERVAAALAEREAATQAASPPAANQPRAPDGKFISPSEAQPQRRSAPSLVSVNGAAASTEPASVSGLDALLQRG